MSGNNEHIALRGRMVRRLGQPVSPAAWALADRQGFVGEAFNTYVEGGEAGLFEFLRDLLRVTNRKPARRTPRHAEMWSSEDLNARIEAVSRLVAEEAAGDEEILKFRHRVLGRDTSMSAEEAEVYLDVPEARQPRYRRSIDPGPTELLKYQNRHIAHDLHVWAGSPLDELRKLSKRLAESYPWQPEQAAAFVLEGLVPRATPFMLHVPQTGEIVGRGAPE